MADLDSIRNAAKEYGAMALWGMLGSSDPSAALSALGLTFLGDTQAPAADIAQEIGRAPDAAEKMKEAEETVFMRQSQNGGAVGSFGNFPVPIDLSANALTNMQDARQRQIASHDTTNKWLAYIVSFAFFLLIMLVYVGPKFHIEIGNGEKDLLFTLMGVVATGWANIIGFYFGSSVGSQQKSQTLDAALTTAIAH